jgi:serine/threonine protein kinase/tetratricopeptide (TPR) repeat protein
MSIASGDLLDGRFALERSVASGGMGVIFRGIDRQTDTLVGVKTMRISGGADRFEREIQILSALQHPAIVTYLAHGRVGDELYLVMEWLEGEDLGARLDGGEVTVEQAVGIGMQVAGALGAAHRQGIVHRDVKPSNVFLADWRVDRVKLLDYGIARGAGMETLTGTGFVLGTPAYMAPEQASGQRDIDARADVYALGALLFRCIAGRPPFEGDTLNELIAATLHRPVPRLSDFAAVAPALEALVAQMLDKNPERRPSDGSAAYAALAAIDINANGFTATLHTQPPGTEYHPAAEKRPTKPQTPEAKSPTAARATVSSVAVLSFLDMSQSKDQGYLCDGIAEELINTLAQLQGIRVAARSSSFQFKSSTADARTIGARLGVDAVLEGGVRKVADRLRVTVQLVDVADGSPRWSHRFDGKLDDVFAIQDEIAASVATALRGMLSTQERDALRRPGTSAEAYEHFLRGRQLLNSSTLRTSVEEAEREFRRAIEIDPHYAPAYAGLAQAYGWVVEWLAGGEALREAADRASRRALELGPQLPESHVARAAVLGMNGDDQAAEREFREAIRLNPNSFEAHYLFARARFQTRDFVESVDLFRRAAEIRLEDYQCMFLLEMPLTRLGRTDEAAAARREGIRRAERQLALEPDNARALILGACALVSDGQRERGLAWANRALAVAPEDPAVTVNAACVYARAGMKEEALARVEKAFGNGWGKRAWIEQDPDYDLLRDDPRFQALVAKLS